VKKRGPPAARNTAKARTTAATTKSRARLPLPPGRARLT
jgi:hypothetical protein